LKITGSRIAPFLQHPNPDVLGILFFGPEQGLVCERSQNVAKTIVKDLKDPFRISEFSGAALRADPPLLIDQAAQLSMTGGKRVIRIIDANDSISEIFKKFLTGTNDHTLVVAEAGSLSPRSSLRKLFENSKKGAAIGCYEDDINELQSVIKETLGHFDLNASGDTLSFLLSNLGSNRLITRSELEKLALYVNSKPNDNSEVLLHDAMACIGDSAVNSLDLIVYAAANGDLYTLDKLLDKAFDDGANLMGILRAVQRHLQSLHLAIGLIENGLPIDKALASIRPPIIFKHKNQFQSQMRNWNQNRISGALELITETEIGCKSTGFPANAGCHRALMRVAQAARIRR
jgi:DNA polymerase-3 subunit delta